ncbi:MAG: shikimate kinase, partial [Pseudomonadota bacterium]
LEVLWKRVSRRDGRPLLKADNPKQVLSDLLDARAPVYAEADIRIRSEEGPHTRAVDAILKALST